MKQGGRFFVFNVSPTAFLGREMVGHLIWAALAGSALLAALLLPVEKFSLCSCVFLRLTGYPCPSCGWTRGFVGMAAGQWATVIRDCPLAAALYAATAVVFAWHAAALILGVHLERGPWLRLDGRRGMAALAAAVLLVLANWIYRLAMGLK